jgi:hypothetical protein
MSSLLRYRSIRKLYVKSPKVLSTSLNTFAALKRRYPEDRDLRVAGMLFNINKTMLDTSTSSGIILARYGFPNKICKLVDLYPTAHRYLVEDFGCVASLRTTERVDKLGFIDYELYTKSPLFVDANTLCTAVHHNDRLTCITMGMAKNDIVETLEDSNIFYD